MASIASESRGISPLTENQSADGAVGAMGGDEDRDSDEEGDEVVGPQGESVAPMKIARDLGAPTPGEVEDQNATHCP